MPVRFFALLLAVCLLFCAMPCAQAATHTISGLFSLSYDETVYTADASVWLDHADERNRWLMLLTADGHVLDASMAFQEGWEHLSLTDPASPSVQWYVEEMTASGFDHLETLEAGGAVFGLFRASDVDGEYLLGETVVSGWAITFFAYYDDPTLPADEALLQQLKGVLETYQPCR